MTSFVLVTGASGFIGVRLLAELRRRGASTRALVRRQGNLAGATETAVVRDQTIPEALREVMVGVHTVMHFAGRAHQIAERAAEPRAEFRRANVDTTRALLAAAGNAGVRRFLFASSVKAVVGETSTAVVTEATPPRPVDDYGITKREAELLVEAADTPGAMRTSIVRLPLVYGPGVRANMLTLLKAVDRGLPLPIGAIHNRRSLVFVGNVADAAIAITSHPAGAGRTFLVSDGAAVSSVELVRALAHALERTPRILPVPLGVLRALGVMGDLVAPLVRLPVTSAALSRLTGSLVVDDSALRRSLEWHPPYTMANGLAETAKWYRSAFR